MTTGFSTAFSEISESRSACSVKWGVFGVFGVFGDLGVLGVLEVIDLGVVFFEFCGDISRKDLLGTIGGKDKASFISSEKMGTTGSSPRKFPASVVSQHLWQGAAPIRRFSRVPLLHRLGRKCRYAPPKWAVFKYAPKRVVDVDNMMIWFYDIYIYIYKYIYIYIYVYLNNIRYMYI